MPKKFILLLVTSLALLVPVSANDVAGAAPDNFKPKAGPTFNSPLGSTTQRRAIFRKIMRSIDSTKRGSVIKIFTWNFATSEGATALLKAQKRGVRVKLIMDGQNNTDEEPNATFRRLKSGLKSGNAKWPKNRSSWARTCKRSCRGAGGASHSKFFMFSEVGSVNRVVMQGSANFTLASTNNQWNDVYTHTNNRPAWRFHNQVFNEAAKDKKLKVPFASANLKNSDLIMFPLSGKGSYDPIVKLLNKVKCNGATNTPNGKTVIRIAPDVIRQDRGMRLARQVRTLWNRGCDVKIGYTVMGIDVGRYLRDSSGRGAVPMKHLVQDFNGDKIFDNYFHLKVMSIVGKMGRDSASYAVVNGSANWSTSSARSDENLGVYYSQNRTLRYQDHVDYWYENFPGTSSRSTSSRSSTSGAQEPESSSDSEQRLVFGSGENAVYEDGTPAAPDGVDPFAKMNEN
ncbi:phospholipase D-like domain-containing protein [Nocardioides sp.]|uniref:phospholipase D-like domain-containing protein n=1 Tax=Nocardioides sp. TaxID=35761 RepID=UPI002B26BE7F|nr:phospholipase D-like domain-containing protein [Nocardioides sp.]